MEAFAHLSILISIILGLGIAELLSGFVRTIEKRRAVRIYSPPILWAFLLLLTHVQTWWSIFGLRSHLDWTFFQFSVVLLQPIVLYMLSALALPRGSAELDLRANYFEHRRWFFALFASLLIVSIGKDLALSGSLPSTTNLLFHAVLFCLAGVGFFIAADRVQRLLAYTAAALIGAYIALLFARLR